MSPITETRRTPSLAGCSKRVLHQALCAAFLLTTAALLTASEPAIRNPHSQITDDDRNFWAFQSPRKGTLSHVQHSGLARNEIDLFLLTKLESHGLTFSPEADRAALIRRAYFDLIGLPPDPDAVEAFLADSRPDAYEKLIDQLLHSPHYGERWGRHWLDAAGYVDGKLDNDLASIYPHEGIWRYRDWVIQAFQQDKPYDRFLIEQLSGDELVDWRRAEKFSTETLDLLSATGFLRNVDDHTDFPQYGIEKRYEVVHELMDMFSTAVLGLTFECCRCHDHKYDPLPQRDYYRLMACFEPAYNVHDWKQPKDRFLADISLPERAAIDAHNAPLDQQITERQSQLQEAEKAKDESRAAEIMNEISGLKGQRKTYGKIQALWDIGPAPASYVHRRGNVKVLGDRVQPGFPEVLLKPGDDAAGTSQDVLGDSTGRRLALARWLTRSDHPLTARVLVNRVWHHHFGRGIVETLGNFGKSGSVPTHPELLDWLALDFMEHGWSIKRLHRQLMTSTAYRQSSRRPNEAADNSDSVSAGERIDPQNELLWRMNLRRLEAEIIRDSVLAVAGTLDRAAGGPPVEITMPADGLSEVKPASAAVGSQRRSVYIFARRIYPLKFLEIFDAPIMPVNCTQRMHSATVLQALALLNSEFLFDQADRMATRMFATVGAEEKAGIEWAFQTALARKATDVELQQSLEFLNEQRCGYESAESSREKAALLAFADLCHMLLCSNEFLYVE